MDIYLIVVLSVRVSADTYNNNILPKKNMRTKNINCYKRLQD